MPDPSTFISYRVNTTAPIGTDVYHGGNKFIGRKIEANPLKAVASVLDGIMTALDVKCHNYLDDSPVIKGVALVTLTLFNALVRPFMIHCAWALGSSPCNAWYLICMGSMAAWAHSQPICINCMGSQFIPYVHPCNIGFHADPFCMGTPCNPTHVGPPM